MLLQTQDNQRLVEPSAITLFYLQVKLNRGLPCDVRIPNAITQRTFAETDAGENMVRCDDAQDMFARLGI